MCIKFNADNVAKTSSQISHDYLAMEALAKPARHDNRGA